MPSFSCSLVWLIPALVLLSSAAGNARSQESIPPILSNGDRLVHEYFRQQTSQITAATLADVETIEDWESRRGTYRRQLLEMLGLDPLPPRTPLQPVITGSFEADGIVVEQLHFQSLPGLYVTANLYRPQTQDQPLPTILYGCGHARVKQGDVSFGNKTKYQHHGIWFAKHGYVAMVIDTIQLGEIEGEHHGTYRYNQWWWNNRGYTPAGVEAWNCVRALDYLQSRDEVDEHRIGMTGRSGGGIYSWWTAAIDDRIKVVVPVAGITNLNNYVVDGCVEGHCDCMFMVNTYQWDYPLVAALVAPRPLLISNTDKDRIFPLDGVIDVHAKVRRIYDLYQAGDKLGLHITEGPHQDTQELRVHAFRWFNRFLKNDESLITMPAEPMFAPETLRVFAELPDDERVTSIAESFVAAVDASPKELTDSALAENQEKWLTALKEKTFRAWPNQETAEPLDATVLEHSTHDAMEVRIIEYASQAPYRLPIYHLRAQAAAPAKELKIIPVDQDQWQALVSGLAVALPKSFPGVTADPKRWASLRQAAEESELAFLVPRGIGLTRWSENERDRTHIRRRFMLLGQTEASAQIYDVRRGLQAIEALMPGRDQHLLGHGPTATWTLYTALFESTVDRLTLVDLATRNREAPDLLNVSRFVEVPQLVRAASARAKSLTLIADAEDLKFWQAVFPSQTEKVVLSPASDGNDRLNQLLKPSKP